MIKSTHHSNSICLDTCLFLKQVINDVRDEEIKAGRDQEVDFYATGEVGTFKVTLPLSFQSNGL